MHLRPRLHASQGATGTDCTESEMAACATAHLLLGFDAFAFLLLVISRGWGTVEVNCSQRSSWTITQLNQQRDDLTLHNFLHTSQHLCTMNSRLETGSAVCTVSVNGTGFFVQDSTGCGTEFWASVTSATVHTNCKDELQAQNRGWWYIVILSMPETAGGAKTIVACRI